MIDRAALIAAIHEAVAELGDGQRGALAHQGWLEPDQVLAGWTGGELTARDVPRRALTEPGLIALGLRRALEPGPAVERDAIGERAIINGDLRVAGDLSITAPVLVLGDLVAGGVVRDCGPDSLVVVAGDLRARGLAASGDFLVLGDLEADVVHGIYNDNSLLIGGALRARFVDCDDHDVSPYGPVEVEHFFELGRQDAVSRATAFLVDELVDEDLWELDWEALFERLSVGEPVFRDQVREPLEPEPEQPTDGELEGIDVDAIIAGTKRRLSRSQIAYADRRSGELWFVDHGAAQMTIFNGSEYWSSKTGGLPGADAQQAPADERVTLWRKRGDLFIEIERFGDQVFVHVGWNNGSMDTFRRRAAELDALRERWSRGFVEVTHEVPGRGALERELANYDGAAARYASLCIRGGALETSDGDRRSPGDLERELADRRAAGWVLKILEWKPFGRMG